ncbi:hypothetical protein L2E82_04093 [Cichorium intybus]|uniref:Uncharacterized protein n=1 Tax=Cichorium intybus TaxID=13427 RepID=A0ACB9H5I5_CICIN|nr:hypothetical protein L2E82_04093 [Cichorium intybus]
MDDSQRNSVTTVSCEEGLTGVIDAHIEEAKEVTHEEVEKMDDSQRNSVTTVSCEEGLTGVIDAHIEEAKVSDTGTLLVLWPECGCQPISLIDLIVSD